MLLDYIQDLLQQEGTPHNTSKGYQHSFKCPFCNDSKERLFINFDNKKFWCHNCSTGGTLVTFLSQLTHIPYKDALVVFRLNVGYEKPLPEELEDEIRSRLLNAPPAYQERYIHPLPKGFIPMVRAHGKAGKEAKQYIRRRGISDKICLQDNIGYVAVKGHYQNRIITPDYEDGNLIYWQARTWEDTPTNPVYKKYFRKIINPSLSKEQIQQGVISIDKSDVISNIDHILKTGVAVICEGRYDAYAIGNVGGCTYGKILSDTQLMKLVSNKDKIDIIMVMYDGDAFEYTLRAADRLYKYFDEVYVCKLPQTEDPSSLGKDGVLEVLNHAQKYNSMMGAIYKIGGI